MAGRTKNEHRFKSIGTGILREEREFDVDMRDAIEHVRKFRYR